DVSLDDDGEAEQCRGEGQPGEASPDQDIEASDGRDDECECAHVGWGPVDEWKRRAAMRGVAGRSRPGAAAPRGSRRCPDRRDLLGIEVLLPGDHVWRVELLRALAQQGESGEIA